MVLSAVHVNVVLVFISMEYSACLFPKWHPILYVMRYKGNKVQFEMHTLITSYTLSSRNQQCKSFSKTVVTYLIIFYVVK